MVLTSLILPLLAGPPVEAAETHEPTPLQQLLGKAGFSGSEQQVIHSAIKAWQTRITAGRGSRAALDCVDRSVGRTALEPCLEPAVKAGDPLGAGLVQLLAGATAAAAGDAGAALARIRAAHGALEGEVDHGSGLWAVVQSNLGAMLSGNGRFEEALGPIRQAIAVQTRLLTAEHPDVAMNQLNLSWALFNLGRTQEAVVACAVAVRDPSASWLASMPGIACFNHAAAGKFAAGDHAGAKALWDRSLAAAEQLLGPEHQDVAVMVGNIGNTLLKMGQPDQAVPLFERAQAIQEKAFGKDHPQAAKYLYFLGEAHAARGAHVEAREQFERWMHIAEKSEGKEGLTVAMALGYVAQASHKLGEYDKAEAQLRRMIAMQEKLAGKDSGHVADGLAKLGELYRETGRLAAAAPLLERVVRIQEKLKGPDHPDLAAGLLNRANLLRDMGDFAETKVLYERALQIYEKAYGPEHTYVGTALTNLAGFLQGLGDYEAAVPMQERAVEIYINNLGQDHEWVATGLNNLAHLHQEVGDKQTSWNLYLRAVEIWVKTLGEGHPHVVTGILNAAILQREMGEYEWSRRNLENALAAAEKRLGKEHSLVGRVAMTLGQVLASSGERKSAKPYYARGLRIMEKTLGVEHPVVAHGISSTGLLHWSLGERKQARRLLGRGLGLLEKNVEPLLDVTSERERIALIQNSRDYLDKYLSLFDRPADGRAAYRAILRWKAVVKSSLAVQRSALIAVQEPALKDKFDALARVRRELAKQVFATPDPASAAKRARAIARLTVNKEALERELSRRSKAFRSERSLMAASVEHVCNRIDRRAALVDFLRYERYTPPAAEAKGRGESTTSYLAMVLPGGRCRRPIRVELGEAKKIDGLIARYRRMISTAASQRRLDQTARKLREAVWDPVADKIGKRSRVWIVPDGALTALPFSALVDEEGQYLIERCGFGYLSTGNDLRRLSLESEVRGKGALVAGGIDYETGAGAAPAPEATATVAARSAPRGALTRFAFLESSAEEAEEVARRIGGKVGDVVTLTGQAASEARIRAESPGKRVLHLATHGFFATGAVRSALSAEGSRSVEGDLGVGVRAAGFNPMVLSGVVLAGANQRGGGAAEDGVLTAEEVVGLDLRAAELVTLSACETGLGEVQDGEGVMGLRRAFALAGARALVLSLWKVPDKETMRLMEGFYGRVAKAQAGDKPEAMRGAQIELIEALREERGEAHPLFWAAFFVSGK